MRFQVNRVKPRFESEEFVDVSMWVPLPGSASENCLDQARLTLTQAKKLVADLNAALAMTIGEP